MPSVPWIRLYHNWPRNRKTMKLRSDLGTAEPILCLWLWAAENAPNGYLGAMSNDDLESAAEWRGERGKAAKALIESGFLDINGNGTMTLHNWGVRTGAGVSNLLKTRERQRELMRNKRANVSANSDAKNSETLLLSSGSEKIGSEKIGSGESKSVSETLALTRPKIRPRTAHDLIHCLKVARERAYPERGLYNAGKFSPKDAREFIELFGNDIEAALETIEKRIELFVKDPAMSPWTVDKFTRNYNAIGTQLAQRNKSVGHSRAEDFDNSKIGDIPL